MALADGWEHEREIMARNIIDLRTIAKVVCVILDRVFSEAKILERPKLKFRNMEGYNAAHEVLYPDTPVRKIEVQVFGVFYSLEDEYKLSICIGDEVRVTSIKPEDLKMSVDEFSDKILHKLVSLFDCVIAASCVSEESHAITARQRKFKLNKMKFKSKARQFNAPWLNRRMVLV